LTLRRQLAAVLPVGLLNTGFVYSVYALCYLAGAAPLLALLIASCLGTGFNFLSTGRLVFGHSPAEAFPRYAALAAGVYVVNAGLLHLAIGAGAGPLEAQLAAMCVTVPLSFVVSKYVVFRR
jgi:putative flippase GtrA